MRLQWKAMREQADLMTKQLREMGEIEELENKVLFLQYRPKIIVRDTKASNFNVADLESPLEPMLSLRS